jgi:hypothetical protein
MDDEDIRSSPNLQRLLGLTQLLAAIAVPHILFREDLAPSCDFETVI